MAAIVAGVATASTTNASSYASGSFTPAANDLLVGMVLASGTVAAAPTLTDSLGLVTFTLVEEANSAAGVDTLYIFMANSLATNAARTLTFDCTGDAATGAVVAAARVSGMTRTGLNAIRQKAKVENQTASPVNEPAFGVSCLTGNPTMEIHGSQESMAPPTNWTERADVGYSTPTTRFIYQTRDSGFTGTQIGWTDTGTSNYSIVVVELDTSAAAISVTPGIVALTTTGLAPVIVINNIAAPDTLALTTTGLAPAVIVGQNVVPSIVALTTTGFAPVIINPKSAIPDLVALVTTGQAPAAVIGQVVTPGIIALTTNTFIPQVNLAFIPGVLAIVTVGQAPTIVLPKVVIPDTKALTTAGQAPLIIIPQAFIPTPLALIIALFQPTVSAIFAPIFVPIVVDIGGEDSSQEMGTTVSVANVDTNDTIESVDSMSLVTDVQGADDDAVINTTNTNT